MIEATRTTTQTDGGTFSNLFFAFLPLLSSPTLSPIALFAGAMIQPRRIKHRCRTKPELNKNETRERLCNVVKSGVFPDIRSRSPDKTGPAGIEGRDR